MAQTGFEFDNIEEFKKRYILEKAQYYALEEDYSYYNPETSNVDGTMIGETFDNGIRLHFLKKCNQKFFEEIGEEELNRLAKEKWEADKQKSIDLGKGT